MPEHTNHLINETSPYLLQHAHNPVEWYPWNNEALQKATRENKPILVSIGYSACHWCHVMEKESFEDEETAAIMNAHFINIKIDREERPDLDHIYMDAVQAMSGSGGWPLNVFLTPDRKPFYGGTYFPPRRAFNRSSWKEVLLGVSNAFKERRNEIEEQANNLTGHIFQSNSFGLRVMNDAAKNELFSREKLKEAFTNSMKTADNVWGGFGNAPKFPQTFIIRFLLGYYWHTKDETALKQALLSLDKMIEGGIYDQLGGGFARYSTDTEWLAPHFEKMLYDNALLIIVLSEAYQLTKIERYKEVIEETTNWLSREMINETGGFYSALDADSEGEEGKFYVWSYDEVKKILGENSDIFCRYYDITQKGNWEGKNIPRLKKKLEDFVETNSMDPVYLKEIINGGKKALLKERSKRIKPGLDDKIILGWNALICTAYCKAYAATGEIIYKTIAEKNMNFLLNNFSVNEPNEFYHTWKNGIAKYPAFLDDYAFLTDALLHLYEISAHTEWLVRAKDIVEFVIENFSEDESGFFFYTKNGQEDIIVRKKEVYDGATPSGNSIMAYNLHRLGIFFDKPQWKARAQNSVTALGNAIVSYPSSFGMWTCFLQELIYTTNEIVILGEEFQKLLTQLLSVYIPGRIIMGAKDADNYYPLMAGRGAKGATHIYLCKDFSCRQPVDNIEALLVQIEDE
ncbi:MAG: thioredoxin domain-containing protein [Bacteroidetes bacterium]|nr:thioredoxin domain-containing protein [Bacteroidota bacterium]